MGSAMRYERYSGNGMFAMARTRLRQGSARSGVTAVTNSSSTPLASNVGASSSSVRVTPSAMGGRVSVQKATRNRRCSTSEPAAQR